MNQANRDLKIINFKVLILILFSYSCTRDKKVIFAGDTEFLRMLNSEKMFKLREMRINDLLAKDDLKVFLRIWISNPHQLDYKWELYTLGIYDKEAVLRRKIICCGTTIFPFNNQIIGEDSAFIPKSEVMKLAEVVYSINWSQVQVKIKEQAYDEPLLVTELLLSTDSQINYVVVPGNENTIHPVLSLFNEISKNAIDSSSRIKWLNDSITYSGSSANFMDIQ